jgi:hypothetical protein
MNKLLIVVTGDSLSAGTEMCDEETFKNYNNLIEQFELDDLNTKRTERWKRQFEWGLGRFVKNRHRQSLDNGCFGRAISSYYEYREKLRAWPKLLESQLDCKVINLARKGSSFKQSCALFGRFVKYNGNFLKNYRVVAVHQIPALIRTYIKHNGEKHRVVDFQHLDRTDAFKYLDQKEHDKKEVIKQRYKALQMRPDYFRRAFIKQLKLIQNIAKKNNILNLFICEGPEHSNYIDSTRIISHYFKELRKSMTFKRGITGNIVDPAYNKWLADLVGNKIKGIKDRAEITNLVLDLN